MSRGRVESIFWDKPQHAICPRCRHPKMPMSKWAVMRLSKDGWFFAKDGTIYCPHRVPDWVEGWRAKKKEQANG